MHGFHTLSRISPVLLEGELISCTHMKSALSVTERLNNEVYVLSTLLLEYCTMIAVFRKL